MENKSSMYEIQGTEKPGGTSLHIYKQIFECQELGVRHVAKWRTYFAKWRRPSPSGEDPKTNKLADICIAMNMLLEVEFAFVILYTTYTSTHQGDEPNRAQLNGST